MCQCPLRVCQSIMRVSVHLVCVKVHLARVYCEPAFGSQSASFSHVLIDDTNVDQ